MLTSVLFLIIFTGVAQASSPPTLGKVNIIHNPSCRFLSQYIYSMLKYEIIHPHSDAIHEILSLEKQITRRDANFSNPLATMAGFDGFYLTQISVGEGMDVKMLNTDFDTGTSDLWVLSTLLQDDQQGGHNLYDPNTSNSSVPLVGETWSDSFQNVTEIGGVVFNETVNIGGITLKNQAVQAASTAIPALIKGSRDGLVGLALGNSSISPDHFPSVIENLMTHPLQQPVFTCVLTRPTEAPGFYTFGYIDESLSNPGIQFNDIVTIGANAPGQWEIKSEYAVLNEMHIAREGNTVAIDTGTPGILLEDSLVQNIYTLLDGQFNTDLQSYTFPANLTEFPTVILPAGMINITLTPVDFAIGPPDAAGWVVGSIQSRKQLPFDVFGHSWMNNIYAVFDLGMTGPDIMRFGLVPRASLIIRKQIKCKGNPRYICSILKSRIIQTLCMHLFTSPP